MKMKLKLFGYSLCIAGLILLASNVYAQPFGDPGNGKMKERTESRMSEVSKELNLSAEQQKQLEAHRKQHREQNAALFSDIKKKRDEIKSELQKPELNMNKINQLQAELKGLMGKIEDDRLNGILEVRKVLTAEQFAKFTQLMEKRRHGGKKWEGSREKGMHKPGMDKSGDKMSPKENK